VVSHNHPSMLSNQGLSTYRLTDQVFVSSCSSSTISTSSITGANQAISASTATHAAIGLCTLSLCTSLLYF